MNEEDGTPMFAFQHLDYIPFGFSGSTAPYIETGPGTMRAAATLMGLDFDATLKREKGSEELPKTMICDLGCGDGEFLINLLIHINAPPGSHPLAYGIGIDYDAALIATAGISSSKLKDVNIKWLVYNFNDDTRDLVTQLTLDHLVTHVFIYLTPKQLALQTVRMILTRLCEGGVVEIWLPGGQNMEAEIYGSLNLVGKQNALLGVAAK
ncbi:hypothetical protein EJ08DRAFT_738190 [Tothia fuscella]|uniref:Methyltransferase domain-containing protein n=1 Tax=Tothia fuscella TaxID=1048955 RepID=A0A9P4NHT2_9PEZI|nr:hypothetical protein EJ08DRAFT_738190 [Tothia fuscella]